MSSVIVVVGRARMFPSPHTRLLPIPKLNTTSMKGFKRLVCLSLQGLTGSVLVLLGPSGSSWVLLGPPGSIFTDLAGLT